MTARRPAISAVDLFCGAGGLSLGLQQAGIHIAAGIDLDRHCQYPFRHNIGAPFHLRDVAELSAADLTAMWPAGSVRVLAGCAPCQPFSPHRRGVDTSAEKQWQLVAEFQRLVKQTLPEIVTMENVPRIRTASVFGDFVDDLTASGYAVTYRSCYCPDYGIAQHRRRLVLLASRQGAIELPRGSHTAATHPTVQSVIGSLPAIDHGTAHPEDALHTSRHLSARNFERIQHSKPGGSWEDWPEELRSPCHRKVSGSTFRNVYARMSWDGPAPTITTLAHNFGTGRFGHPEQDRAISLREAATLQSFPPDYALVAPGEPVQFGPLGRLIGNAVPPRLAAAVGATIVDHVRQIARAGDTDSDTGECAEHIQATSSAGTP